jgi:hypothetical protein
VVVTSDRAGIKVATHASNTQSDSYVWMKGKKLFISLLFIVFPRRHPSVILSSVK